jgi:TRAP-type C4-dicarboxylate transport system permease large subunit
VFKGVLPFLAADFLHLALLIAIPGMALALPRWLE